MNWDVREVAWNALLVLAGATAIFTVWMGIWWIVGWERRQSNEHRFEVISEGHVELWIDTETGCEYFEGGLPVLERGGAQRCGEAGEELMPLPPHKDSPPR